MIISYFLAAILFPAVKATTQFIKASLAISIVIAALLFGNQFVTYITNVVTGQAAIGYRAAQDGVSSRLDEFQRGYSKTKPIKYFLMGISLNYKKMIN